MSIFEEAEHRGKYVRGEGRGEPPYNSQAWEPVLITGYGKGRE